MAKRRFLALTFVSALAKLDLPLTKPQGGHGLSVEWQVLSLEREADRVSNNAFEQVQIIPPSYMPNKVEAQSVLTRIKSFDILVLIFKIFNLELPHYHWGHTCIIPQAACNL